MVPDKVHALIVCFVWEPLASNLQLPCVWVGAVEVFLAAVSDVTPLVRRFDER
jgi:hypothetical protein